MLVTLTRQGDEGVPERAQRNQRPPPKRSWPTCSEPFKRESADNQRNRNGLGIGLYISQAIAQAHQGRIDVDRRDDVITFLPAPAGAPGGDRPSSRRRGTVHNATLAGIFGSHRRLTGIAPFHAPPPPPDRPRLPRRASARLPALARVEVHSAATQEHGRC